MEAAVEDVNAAINNLEGIGNFSRAQADEVLIQLDAAIALANSLPAGAEREALLDEFEALQTELEEMIEARYVTYTVLDGSLDELKLSVSTSLFSTSNARTQNNNPVYLNSGGETEVIYLRYSNFSFVNPVAGDVATFENVRFRDGKENITIAFRNLGDGNWEIESDWFVEAE